MNASCCVADDDFCAAFLYFVLSVVSCHFAFVSGYPLYQPYCIAFLSEDRTLDLGHRKSFNLCPDHSSLDLDPTSAPSPLSISLYVPGYSL